ncbi:hypothetical protein XELAEV_18047995mg, partial [Xenopus laevis]
SQQPVDVPRNPQSDLKVRTLGQKSPPIRHASTTVKIGTLPTSLKLLNPSVIKHHEDVATESFHTLQSDQTSRTRITNEWCLPSTATPPSQVSKFKSRNYPPTSLEPPMHKEKASSVETNFQSEQTVRRTIKQLLPPKPTLPSQESKYKNWNCPPTSSEPSMYEEKASNAKTILQSDQTVRRTSEQCLPPKPTLPSQRSKFKSWHCPPTSSVSLQGDYKLIYTLTAYESRD